MTTIKQLNMLSELKKFKQCSRQFVEWAFEGITDTDIEELELEGLISISNEHGYVGGLKTLTLTDKGEEFISDFCDVCECMPCDCGYGS